MLNSLLEPGVSVPSIPIADDVPRSPEGVRIRWSNLITGEHLKEPYAKINPNRMVPVFEDGDFRLTESSSILKYLADKLGSSAYPTDPKKRARVNEMLDWINSNLYRDLGYGFIYPQIFPHHKRPDEKVQAATLAWAKERAQGWLKILDENYIGPRNKYLLGDEITIADYFGAAILTAGDTVGCKYAAYPNVCRWLANMRSLPNWNKVNQPFNELAKSMSGGKHDSI